MKLHYQHYLNSYAQNLRKSGNLSEVLLWNELKQDKLGYRFLRQRPIGEYIVDFFCHALNLAIEIDGAASHDDKMNEDLQRQRTIESIGVTVIRFKDSDVRYNLEGVVESIQTRIHQLEWKSSGSLTRHLL
jgi:very-short-patch-repair endonuclease